MTVKPTEAAPKTRGAQEDYPAKTTPDSKQSTETYSKATAKNGRN